MIVRQQRVAISAVQCSGVNALIMEPAAFLRPLRTLRKKQGDIGILHVTLFFESRYRGSLLLFRFVAHRRLFRLFRLVGLIYFCQGVLVDFDLSAGFHSLAN